MLENTPFWTHGSMNLWLNNKPARAYVPKENVKTTYETLKSRLCFVKFMTEELNKT